MGSTLVVEVVPAVATTQNGFLPAAISSSTSRESTPARISKRSFTGTWRTRSWPMPSAMAPFSTEECDCSDVYSTRLEGTPRRRTCGAARSRAAAMACMVEMDAVS
jgi:hypothetical protein